MKKGLVAIGILFIAMIVFSYIIMALTTVSIFGIQPFTSSSLGSLYMFASFVTTWALEIVILMIFIFILAYYPYPKVVLVMFIVEIFAITYQMVVG